MSALQMTPMSNEQLKASAPSIFSETPIAGVSNIYSFVPTHSVLDTFRQAGFFPIMASESQVRNSDNQGYQKHIIQFRSLDNLLRPDANDEYADIVLTNSHNRTSSFKVDLSYWRIICSNMLTVPSHTLSQHSIKHVGFTLDKVKNAIDEVTSYMPKIEKEIEQFKTIQLTPLEQHSLAKAAIDIRFDRDTHVVDSNEFLQVNRDEDNSSSLWVVYNRIQEPMVRGGIKGNNIKSGKSFTSKAINTINSLKLNKELFSTVQMMAGLKVSTPMLAA